MKNWVLNLFLGLFFLLSPMIVFGEDWKPIDPAHTALKAPVVEKDADAEAIFWEVRVLDEVDGFTVRTVLSNYIRIKIFTDRGKDTQTKVEIPYLGSYKIKDIAGRTIKADGSILELKKDAVFDRIVINTNGLKIKVKSFAMPGVEPGSIIEYRWKEIRNDTVSLYSHLDLQRDIPIQQVKYFIKPLSLPNLSYGMRIKNFNTGAIPLNKEKDGYVSTTLTNVPALHKENYMPPDDTIQSWMLVYYSEDKNQNPDIFWPQYGKEVYEKTKDILKPDDSVKKLTASLLTASDGPKEKLDKIFFFCRTKIKNSRYTKLSDEELKKVKDITYPKETLKLGAGAPSDILFLFGAMANAAGLEARIARLSDRSKSFFDKRFTDSYFMKGAIIAVQVGTDWLFFDPASLYVSSGMLSWKEEGQEALICDAKQPVFVRTPLSGPEKSVRKRNGIFKITEDGSLEGTVKIQFTGHFDEDKKEDYDSDSPKEEQEALEAEVKKRISTAEISDFKIENVDSPDNPFTYSYHVRIPGYCQKTGKRLFLQPAYFNYGLDAIFPAGERKYPIYFPFPWSEEDHISFEFPTGYELENPSVPQGLTISTVGKYTVKMQYAAEKRLLSYQRFFNFGNGGSLLYPKDSYQQIKPIFDMIQERDKHVVTLKQKVDAQSSSTTNQQ